MHQPRISYTLDARRKEKHRELMMRAWKHRGYNEEEATSATDICEMATWYGVSSHNGLKALAVDDAFGARASPQGCVPGAPIVRGESMFSAVQSWTAPGSSFVAATAAMDECMAMAEAHGIGIVSVDSAFDI